MFKPDSPGQKLRIPWGVAPDYCSEDCFVTILNILQNVSGLFLLRFQLTVMVSPLQAARYQSQEAGQPGAWVVMWSVRFLAMDVAVI